MKTKSGIETVDRATGTTPWTVFAGTCIQDASGKTIMVACESNEGRGGTFESIRETVKRSVHAVNTHADLFQERDRLREVNADLLAACEAIVRLAHRTEMDTRPIDGGAICHLAWDAISKAKAL